MILHIATFTFKDDVTPEDVAQLTRELLAMAADIPEVKSYRAGENLRLRPGGADYGVAAVVADEAALAAYLDSDAHKGVYERLLGRMIEARQAVQLPADEGTVL